MLAQYVAEQTIAARSALIRTATATGEFDIIPTPALQHHAGGDLSKVKVGLRVLHNTSVVCAISGAVVIGSEMRETIAELIEQSLLHLHVEALVFALIEMSESGVHQNGRLLIQQVKCFVPDWVKVDRALRYLETNYRCVALDGAVIMFTGKLAMPTALQ